MRKLFAIGLVGLAGCANCTANLCDTFFKARNVCRDQEAQQSTPMVAAPAPVIVAGPSMGCAGQVICSGPMMASEPYGTEVYASPVGCDCAGGTVVYSPTCVGCAGEGVVVGSTVIASGAGSVETVSDSKGHPLTRPFRWMFKHHNNGQ